MDFIYIQAKRWDTQSVCRPDIQSFVGALDGQRATKGIFITISRFAENARDMIDYGLGVSTSTTYEVKKIDSDYFGES